MTLEPMEPKIRQLEDQERFGKFLVEPLEKGYGVTLGNSLRRVLLSSIPGAALTTVKFDGALHEFSTLPGVMEDVTEIMLNLKELAVRVVPQAEEPAEEKEPDADATAEGGDANQWTARIHAQGKGEVTGADVEVPPALEICSPEVHIATLTADDAKLDVEMIVETGVGYVPAQRRDRSELPIGTIPIDAIYTPIRRVNYVVEPTRLGQKTDYDRLVLEIWTNGTIAPAQALSEAAKILTDQLRLFFDFSEREKEEREKEQEEARRADQVLEFQVKDMDFSVRTFNCLRKENIETLGQLIQYTEEQLLDIRNFGKKSLTEVIDKLDQYGLKLKESPQEKDEFTELHEDEFDVDLELDDEIL